MSSRTKFRSFAVRDGRRGAVDGVASTSSIAVCAIGRSPMLRAWCRARVASSAARVEVHQRIQGVEGRAGHRSFGHGDRLRWGREPGGSCRRFVVGPRQVPAPAKILLVNPFHRRCAPAWRHWPIPTTVPAIPRTFDRALRCSGVSKRWGKVVRLKLSDAPLVAGDPGRDISGCSMVPPIWLCSTCQNMSCAAQP